MSSEFIIKSIASEESADDETWQEYEAEDSDIHASDGNSENGVAVEVIKNIRLISKTECHPRSCD